MIIKYPDKRLRQKSNVVTDFAEAKKIVAELESVTAKIDSHFKPWLGMAAPQIGHNKKIILLKNSYKDYTVMVNPEILEQKWLLPIISRCYSLSGFYISRYHFYFKVKYQDLEGSYHEEVIKGGRAVALQQEIDHIDGVLLLDKGIRVF